VGRERSEHPTELELQILKVLWQKAPAPVRDIRADLAKRGRALAHTSVITMLNIMVRKGYLKRTKQANAFFFEPTVTHAAVSRQMLGDMVNRVFDGSAKDVLLTLFDASEVDADELKEIRRYINRKAREQSP
jgi:BlaI family transcriptional regulator, penicillinase repressor